MKLMKLRITNLTNEFAVSFVIIFSQCGDLVSTNLDMADVQLVRIDCS